FYIKHIIFWITLFLSHRIFFLLNNFDNIEDEKYQLILKSFLVALRMDFSVISYIFALLVLLFLFFNYFNKWNLYFNSVLIISMFFIILSSVLNIFDAALTQTWESRINARALSYLAAPGVAIEYSTAVNLIPLIIYFILCSGIFAYFYKYLFRNQKDLFKESKKYGMVVNLLLIPLIVIGLRGGVGNNPIGKSSIYFSNSRILNLTTLNPVWNFISIFKDNDFTNPYTFFNKTDAENIFKTFSSTSKDTTEYILNLSRPNIIIILIESMSAENLQYFGNKESVTPYLDSLAINSLVFSDFYATGYRTEQGLVSLLSGFPSQPKSSILRESNKIIYLPNIGNILKNYGYCTLFTYRGNLDYSRTDEYLKLGGFDDIYDRERFKKMSIDFNNFEKTDDLLYESLLNILDEKKEPFFSVSLTSVSHTPFNANVEKIFKQDDIVSRYKNTIHCTDKALRKFIDCASKKSWYNNTLFIVSADHAEKYPNKRNFNEPLRHKIPLILFGSVLKNEYTGVSYDQTASQFDFPKTLLKQLKIDDNNDFIFSKNLFNKYYNNFAYYSFDHGFGIIDGINSVTYNLDTKEASYRGVSSECDSLKIKGLAFLQFLTENIINY
ncbi:MAG: LTA synthase family protein, partial [Candidatus Delongbacteria bacterium]|nr:LTA synthase family protein [Candidatus Delongbacteria bacterium]